MFGSSARAEPRPLRRQWLPKPRKAAARCANDAGVLNLNAASSSKWRVLKLNRRGLATLKLGKKETRKVCLTKQKQKRKVFVQVLDLASCKASDVFRTSSGQDRAHRQAPSRPLSPCWRQPPPPGLAWRL